MKSNKGSREEVRGERVVGNCVSKISSKCSEQGGWMFKVFTKTKVFREIRLPST